MLLSRMNDGSHTKGFSLFALWVYELVLRFALLQVLLLSAGESVTVNFSSKLSNIAINPLNGDIYVGAVNRLYQLDSNLDNKHEAETGPQRDNPDCYSGYNYAKCISAQDQERIATDTNNFNQILEVDLKHNQLIACGTVYHGTCERRNLSDIGAYVEGSGTSYIRVGSNDANFLMVGLVAPGPSGDDILYVGTSSSGKTSSEYLQTNCRSGICSLSMTAITRVEPFGVLLTDSGDREAAELHQTVFLNYKPSYVAAFSIDNYSYFLTRLMENQLVSKIVQVCQRDQYYDSYVETRIECNTSDYSLIQAGVFVQPDSYWANELRITASDYIFLGAFSSSSSPSSSGVCVYRLKDIRSTFTTNIQQCDSGNMDFSSGFDPPKKQCTRQVRE